MLWCQGVEEEYDAFHNSWEGTERSRRYGCYRVARRERPPLCFSRLKNRGFQPPMLVDEGLVEMMVLLSTLLSRLQNDGVAANPGWNGSDGIVVLSGVVVSQPAGAVRVGPLRRLDVFPVNSVVQLQTVQRSGASPTPTKVLTSEFFQTRAHLLEHLENVEPKSQTSSVGSAVYCFVFRGAMKSVCYPLLIAPIPVEVDEMMSRVGEHVQSNG